MNFDIQHLSSVWQGQQWGHHTEIPMCKNSCFYLVVPIFDLIWMNYWIKRRIGPFN
jgi:hypothetical protein